MISGTKRNVLSREATWIVLVLAALSIAACSHSAASSQGPLQPVMDRTTACSVAPLGGDFGVGFVVTVSGSPSVTVKSVSLVEPSGVELADSVLLDPYNDAISFMNVPPSSGDPFDLQHRWDARTQAVGATIEQGKPTNMVLVVRFLTEDSKMSGATISYEAGGRPYVYDVKIEVDHGASCSGTTAVTETSG